MTLQDCKNILKKNLNYINECILSVFPKSSQQSGLLFDLYFQKETSKNEKQFLFHQLAKVLRIRKHAREIRHSDIKITNSSDYKQCSWFS